MGTVQNIIHRSNPCPSLGSDASEIEKKSDILNKEIDNTMHPSVRETRFHTLHSRVQRWK